MEALHSHPMLKKQQSSKLKSKVPCSAQHSKEWQYLQCLKIKKERWAELPIPIQQLQNGRLDMVTPELHFFGSLWRRWHHM